MRSTGFLGKLLPLALCAAAAFAIGSGCKSSTAGGSAGPGMEGDGGMSGSMSNMADAGASMGRDMGQAAGNAASSAASGAQSAGESMADAGASAYGAASSAAAGAANDMADAGSQMASADMDAGGGSSGSAGGGSSSGSSEPAGGSSGGGASMSDPQIAAVAVAANKVDVDAGKLAKTKSKNAKVKKFANDMIRDHTSAIKQATQLVKKLGVTPEENDTSKSLTQGGKENLANLKKLKGKEFDKAYMEHEVAYHQQVLDALDKALIPSAQNADLKSLLESVRGVVAQHLDHANQVSQSLSK
jgi:putative membrane protein